MTKTRKHRSRARTTSRRPPSPWHKRLLTHPFTLLVLLCCGVVLVGAVWQAHADTIQLTAKVSAPLPTAPAVITSPQDQQHVSDAALTVEGSCPPNTYVQLYVNGSLSGSGVCSAGGFSIQVLLSPGANQLQAKVFNTTDDEGPESSPIIVYYDVPASPQPGTNPTTPTLPSPSSSSAPAPASSSAGNAGVTGTCISPLTLVGDYHYQAHYTGEEFSWLVHITNGCSPYQIVVDWGDGQQSTMRRDQIGDIAIELTHTYQRSGDFQPIVRATDANDARAEAQLMAVVHARPVPSPASPLLAGIERYVWILVPVYAVVALMAVSFWLGELQASKLIAHFHAKIWKRKSRLK